MSSIERTRASTWSKRNKKYWGIIKKLMTSSAVVRAAHSRWWTIINAWSRSCRVYKTRLKKHKRIRTNWGTSRRMRRRRCCLQALLRAALNSKFRATQFKSRIAYHSSKKTPTTSISFSLVVCACHPHSTKHAAKLHRISSKYVALVWWTS